MRCRHTCYARESGSDRLGSARRGPDRTLLFLKRFYSDREGREVWAAPRGLTTYAPHRIGPADTDPPQGSWRPRSRLRGEGGGGVSVPYCERQAVFSRPISCWCRETNSCNSQHRVCATTDTGDVRDAGFHWSGSTVYWERITIRAATHAISHTLSY